MDMLIVGLEKLLDSETKTILEMLKLLHRSNDQWMHQEEIQSRVNISKPTLLKYIGIIQKNDDKSFSLQYSQSQGIRLEIYDEFLFGVYYRRKIFDMWPTQLVFQLLLYGKISKSDFCREFFLSESTFEKKISDINILANHFGINIKSRQGTYELVGPEPLIRRILEEIVWEIFKGYEWPFDVIDENKVKRVLSNLFKNEKIKLSSKRVLEYRLAILLIRFNKSYYYKNTEPLFNELFKGNVFFNFMNQLFQKEFLLSVDEVAYFSLSIIANRNYKTTKNFNKSDMFKINDLFKNYFSEYVTNFSDTEIEELNYFLLSSHVYCLLYINTNHIYQRKESKLEANPKVESLLENYLNYFHKNSNGIFKENAQFLFYKYQQIIMNMFPPEAIYPLKVIAVNTDMNMLEEKKFIHFLTKTLNVYSNVFVDSIQNMEVKDIDLLIYTNKDTFYTDIPNSIYIDRYSYLDTLPSWLNSVFEVIFSRTD